MLFHTPRWRRLVIAATVMTAVVVGGAATPAHAAFLYCQDVRTRPSVWCDVPYQTFPYGQTTGLRSSMIGSPQNTGISALQENGFDEIRVSLTVWDLSTDGYRARVWIDIYQGCWCVDSAYHIASTENGDGGNQGATRVFDSTISSGRTTSWVWDTSNGAENYYVVRLRLGRFQFSTGRYEFGEEQRYHLYVYQL